MFDVQVKGVDFAKVLRNVILWQEPGISYTQGRAFVSFSAVEVSLYATDGYTAVRDWIEYTGSVDLGDTIDFWLTEDEMDTLLLAAVEAKAGPLTIHVTALGVKLDYSVIPEDKENKTKKSLKEGTIFLGERSTVPEWVDALEEALEEAEHCALHEPPHDFAIRPERFVKFFRVRADKEAPVDFRLLAPMNEKSGPMAAVKIGFTFRGLVNFVNREVALENLTEEQRVFLW